MYVILTSKPGQFRTEAVKGLRRASPKSLKAGAARHLREFALGGNVVAYLQRGQSRIKRGDNFGVFLR